MNVDKPDNGKSKSKKRSSPPPPRVDIRLISGEARKESEKPKGPKGSGREKPR